MKRKIRTPGRAQAVARKQARVARKHPSEPPTADTFARWSGNDVDDFQLTERQRDALYSGRSSAPLEDAEP